MPTTWDAKLLRFRGAQGRFIKRESVHASLERARDEGKARVRTIAQQLVEGKINIAEFTIRMRDEIKAMHTLHGGIAIGGRNQMSPAALGRIGRISRDQYAFLSRLSRQISNGEQALGGSLLRRVSLYIAAAHSTYAEQERLLHRDGGYTLARRVLHSSEQCDGCSSEANKGWQPIDDIAPIGSKECRVNCQCTLLFS